MVRQTFSIILNVDRDLPQETLADWIDQSLAGVVEMHTFQVLAVTYLANQELVYGQIKIYHFTTVTTNLLRKCLSSPPPAIKVADIVKVERRNLTANPPARPQTRPILSRLENVW
ncbi:MAG: hypothetical protein P4N59_17365 [Negativicutes bacterium]|nr:hypothetical protein [Negativicutes bacterium]